MMWKFIVLSIVAGINLLTGLWVFFKNYKSRLRLSFLLLSIALCFWSLGNGLAWYYISLNQFLGGLFWLRITYIAALLIAPALVYFSYYAPLELPLDTRFRKFLVVPIFFAIYLVFNPSFIMINITPIISGGFDTNYNILGCAIFSLAFLFFTGLAFYILIKRYLFSDGIIKKGLGYILLGLSGGVLFGVVFDLILPFTNNWQFNGLGPIFSLFLAFSIVYLILHKEK